MTITDRLPRSVKTRLLVYCGCGAVAIIIILALNIHSKLDRAPLNCVENVKRFKPYKYEEDFKDLQKILDKPIKLYGAIIIRPNEMSSNNSSIWKLVDDDKRNITHWDNFFWSISKNYLYDYDHDQIISKMISDMATQPIVSAEELVEMHLSILVILLNGRKAVLKPKRISREYQTNENHFYFSDYDRHNADIAAFHLDRVLGFRRVMPVVGRMINITNDIKENAVGQLQRNFFQSPANNTCFQAYCGMYCEIMHPICGEPDTMEMSIKAFIPDDKYRKRETHMYPWSRTFSPFETADWESDENYCEKIRNMHPYNETSMLLEIVDTAIFDFLMGNLNRGEFDVFKIFGNDSFTLLADNGRAFGRPFVDERTILAPLYQCCLIREQTLQTLLRFHNGSNPLSNLMRISLSKDPIAPILWEPHLIAFDRRVELILLEIRKCLLKGDNI